MKLEFICLPKCTTCQKAQAWLDSHSKDYTIRDIKVENPTKEEITSWLKKSGLEIKSFFNTSGLVYKSLDLKNRLSYMTLEEKILLLSDNGMLVKRPIVISGDIVLVGFKEKAWQEQII